MVWLKEVLSEISYDVAHNLEDIAAFGICFVFIHQFMTSLISVIAGLLTAYIVHKFKKHKIFDRDKELFAWIKSLFNNKNK